MRQHLKRRSRLICEANQLLAVNKCGAMHSIGRAAFIIPQGFGKFDGFAKQNDGGA
jgi:hypothetical protein